MSRGGTIETDQVRTAVRFPMKLALQIKTSTGVIEAVTENISANGILFTGKRLPPVRSQIEFTVQMPAEVMGTPEDVVIHCIGRVVRHQRNGDEAQAAAIIDEYYLRV
jgi:PilZ domain